MTRLTLCLSLLSSIVFAQPVATSPSGFCAQDGELVHCEVGAFKVLVDSLVDAQASVEKLQLQLTAKDAQLEALKAALLVPPPAVVKFNPKPLVAVVTAVLGAAAMMTGIAVDTLSPGARVGLGITGAAAVAGSFVIVF